MSEIAKFKATVPQMSFPESSYAVETGVESAQQYAFPATSHSNSASSFQINVPNTSSIMDRRVLLEMPVVLDFVCPDTGVDCIIDGRDGWRASPLEAICDNLRCTINGLTISTQPRYNRQPLLMYGSNDSRQHMASVGPSQPDQYSDYEDSVGATNSSFGSIQFQDYQSAVGRGAYDWTITNVTATGAKVEATLRTFVKLAPFMFGSNDESKGLVNVNQMTFNFSWTNLARLWSRDNDPDGILGAPRPLTSLTVQLQTPTIYTTFYNASLNTQVPSSVDYAYANIVVNSTQFTAPYAAYEQKTLNSSSFRFDIIPSYIYLWVGRAFSEVDSDVNSAVGSSDAVFSIQQVSLLFDNRDSNLNSASPSQLYQFSVQEGLNQGFVSFVGKSEIIGAPARRVGLAGSILKISFGKMVGLKSGLLPGMSGVYNFSSRLQCTNESKRSVLPEMQILTVQEGLLRVGSGSASSFLGVMTAADYGNLEEMPTVPHLPVQIYGGSFASKATEMLQSLASNPFLKAACSLVSQSGSGVPGGQARAGSAVAGRKSLKMR